MNDVVYTNNRGNKITLSGYPYFLDVEPLFDYEWSYSSKDSGTGSRLKGFYKDVKEKQLTLSVYGHTEAARNKAIDALNSVIETDIFDNTPGKITVGSWYCYGYITAAANTGWNLHGPVCTKTVTLVNERQSWYNVLKRDSYGNAVKMTADTWDKQYEACHQYDYDYTNNGESQLILNNPSVNESEFVLTVQGPATSPYLGIGDNVYHITADVPDGAVLVIDSTKKTALMTLATGVVVNVFSARDSDHYLFKRIASGQNAIVYDGTFLWQLDVIEERSEPRWLTA